MTTQPILLKLAQQGDASAITALMNAALHGQAIRVKAQRDDRCLQILLKAANPLNQHACVAFMRRGLLRLRLETIDSVRAYAWQTGREFPSWVSEFSLDRVPLPYSRLKPLLSLSHAELQTLAVAGNADALMVLLNRAVSHTAWSIKAVWKYRRLYILVEADQVPAQEFATLLIGRELINLPLLDVEIVKLYGRAQQQKTATWVKELKPRSVVEPSRELQTPELRQLAGVTGDRQAALVLETPASSPPLELAVVEPAVAVSRFQARSGSIRDEADFPPVADPRIETTSLPQPEPSQSRDISQPSTSLKKNSLVGLRVFQVGFAIVLVGMMYWAVH